MNLATVFDFIKERRGYDYPFMFKLINELPFTDDELTIDGDLILFDMFYHTLPDNLTVKGDLLLGDSEFAKIPNNLKVKGVLDITNTPIASKYDEKTIKKMIKDNGGKIGGSVYT